MRSHLGFGHEAKLNLQNHFALLSFGVIKQFCNLKGTPQPQHTHTHTYEETHTQKKGKKISSAEDIWQKTQKITILRIYILTF